MAFIEAPFSEDLQDLEGHDLIPPSGIWEPPTLEHHQEAGPGVGEEQGKGSAESGPGCCHPLGQGDECLLWPRTRALSQFPAR